MAVGTRVEKNLSGDKDNMLALQARGRRIHFPRRPLVMGILNINDDSFSGDGQLDPGWALGRAAELVAEGADIIDVGGESARTNRPAVGEDEEWRRIGPFLKEFAGAVREARPRDGSQVFPPLLSVNTWRTGVAARAVEAGCDILNDLSALPGPEHARICARSGAALLIMHSRGEPKVPHTHVGYPDVMVELESFFTSRLELACSAGLDPDAVILDPGIDFAKQAADNLRIFRELELLNRFRRPVLLPVSRKGTIGRVLGIENPADRDAGTVACIVAGALRGAAIFRVHNVDAAWAALRTLEAVS